MAKRVRIVIEAEAPDNVQQEEIAERFGRVLHRAGLRVALGGDEQIEPHEPVKTAGPRVPIGAGGMADHEARLWEKATCNFPGFDPSRLDDVIINPRVNVQLPDRLGDVGPVSGGNG